VPDADASADGDADPGADAHPHTGAHGHAHTGADGDPDPGADPHPQAERHADADADGPGHADPHRLTVSAGTRDGLQHTPGSAHGRRRGGPGRDPLVAVLGRRAADRDQRGRGHPEAAGDQLSDR
jgi:hypothetical protein